MVSSDWHPRGVLERCSYANCTTCFCPATDSDSIFRVNNFLLAVTLFLTTCRYQISVLLKYKYYSNINLIHFVSIVYSFFHLYNKKYRINNFPSRVAAASSSKTQHSSFAIIFQFYRRLNTSKYQL